MIWSDKCSLRTRRRVFFLPNHFVIALQMAVTCMADHCDCFERIYFVDWWDLFSRKCNAPVRHLVDYPPFGLLWALLIHWMQDTIANFLRNRIFHIGLLCCVKQRENWREYDRRTAVKAEPILLNMSRPMENFFVKLLQIPYGVMHRLAITPFSVVPCEIVLCRQKQVHFCIT